MKPIHMRSRAVMLGLGQSLLWRSLRPVPPPLASISARMSGALSGGDEIVEEFARARGRIAQGNVTTRRTRSSM
jgi:hypothetical protein